MDGTTQYLDEMIKKSSGGKLTAEEVISDYRDRLVKETSTDIAETYKDPRYHSIYKQMKNNVALDKNYWKKSKAMRRHLASIPPEVYWKAIEIYGSDVFKDKKYFKEAFAKDELGQLFLLVPYSEL